ncbi:tetratricopeptide repeat protein [Plectonema cf. radiosum LEGE 06105]|uniref:Tetratricopeptide repeat protein n=1 Tax=Plectonema cf. radiosum LEGE 06105 TaxID=945769 RepID=A0A8J7F2H5_9CYAN|nr:serine protease [Plectonema radiosum]MBE9214956.1 tetratricopeptide repeat protein [Plectonema cf. radiosum LEGE 06105]
MKRFNIVALAGLSSLLILPSSYAEIPQKIANQTNPILASNTLSPEKIRQLAQAVTVKVLSNNKGGSGVLISKQGQTYTILTNAHVISTKGTHSIQTPDGKTHKATVISSGNSLSGNDLAVLQFQAQDNYQIVTLATNSNLSENQEVLAAGFPDHSKELVITNGKISLLSPQPLIGGYQIGYTNEIRQGMSGGTLLNQEGKLIGINGLNNNAILNDTYTYEDGTVPNAEEIQRLKKFSFAVPIQTLAKVAPNLAIIPPEWRNQQQAENPPVGNTLADKINNIAQKITVKIDSRNNGNGSGVIIARQGQTYYVATARHVVKNPDSYEIITPDGKRYAVQPENIIKSDLTHAVLIKFTSNEMYSVATISTYNQSALDYINQKPKTFWVFLSGFPEKSVKPQLTSGYLQEREQLFTNTDNSELLKNFLNDGYRLNLSYSNLSLPGTSGGPLLDAMGQVIGINGGSDKEEIEKTNIGFGYGTPSSSILGLATQAGIKLVVSSETPSIKDSEINSLWKHPLFAVKSPPANANEDELFKYANELWRIKKYSETMVVLEQILKVNKNSYKAHYVSGLVLSNKEDKYEKSLDAFEKAIAIKPYSSEAWKLKTDVLLNKLKKYPLALAAVDKAIEYDTGEDFSLYLYRSAILLQLQRYPEALTAINQAINKIHELELNYFIRANLYVILRSYEKALADLNQAIKLQPNDANNYVLRGIVRKELNKYKEALQDYNLAIKLQPNNGNAYYWRGDIFYVLNKYQEAFKDANTALKILPSNDIRPLILRGNISIKLNDYQAALADYNQVIKLDPNNGNAYYWRAEVLHLLNNYQEALADSNQALKLLSQNDTRPLILRGIIHKNLKNYQAALADFNNALKTLPPDDSRPYYWRGNVYYWLRDYQAALADYNQAIKLQADDANAYYWRGVVRYFLIDYQAALTDLNQAIKLQPNNFRNYYWRGFIRNGLKDYQSALADCNQTIKLQPNDAAGYYCRGVVYQKQGNDNAALSEYAQALAKDKKFGAANAKIGYIKYERGDVAGAIQEWQKAIQIDSDLTGPQLALAVVLHSRGEQQKALSMAQATLGVDKYLADVEVLKQTLWGTKLIAEGEKLLAHPNIQVLRVKK